MTTAATPVGLRERKKRQTRTRIIEVALDLCQAQGFERTTVEQIAEAADVSARTVNRYFETKDDIILGPVEDVLRVTTELLRAQPVTGDELRALCDAYLGLLDRIAAAGEPIAFDRFRQMHRILRDTPAVAARSREFGERKAHAMATVVADRLGAEPTELRVRLTIATWQAIMHVALDEWDNCGSGAACVAHCRRSVVETFDAYRHLAATARSE
ncbi:TetR/AcrR family transcriptional regulator [Skermania piniformis]|uniref:TetR/AcrR family transcriptional regulator n=1 Tax=Skermania pinensis TaxID=39122 RepID=A0ABX8S888_9ACTN|nr:TetR/AcrR family transcriptional regulator [Skermania piniformis]QXQ13377.1 TetR/AcrR family transcriptional regulator [Skermania piniformis]